MESFAPRRRSKLSAEMNVVPYIDVMLVLLVIFMVTAPLMQTSVEVSLPQGEGNIVNEEDEPVVLTVAKSGLVYLSVADDPQAAIEVPVAAALIARLLRLNPQLKVNVAADQSLGYGEVMSAIQWLRESGVSQVGLVTEPLES